MNHTKIELLLLVIAWTGLIGGILFGALVSYGIFESAQDMAFPQAVVTFVGYIFVSVAGWAALMQVVNISDRLKKIENQLSK